MTNCYKIKKEKKIDRNFEIKANKSRSRSHDWPKKAPKPCEVLQRFFVELNESMKLLQSEHTSTRFGENLPIMSSEMWYVFDFSWKIVAIIVQSGSHRYSCGSSNGRLCNRSVRTTLTTVGLPSCMCLFDRTEDRINISTWTIISMHLTETRLRRWGTLKFTILLF